MKQFKKVLMNGINKYTMKNKKKYDFKKYDAENPQIYLKFKDYTKILIQRGFKNYSAMAVMQAVRWHTDIEGNDKFKVNHNYFPDYARKFMKEFPQHEGFFRTNKLSVERT